ncbi:M48 family metallopeptidase [Rosistilla oblonga]|uniref:M48 family metallopeptidase n=1 Tax=Rosistilla oblonga TaxID=2527990 RepID=UPI003A973093
MPTTVDYTVRRSPRAKNIRLKVTPSEGLVVTLPTGFDDEDLLDILAKKKAWISDAFAKADETRRFLEPQPNEHLPQQLNLQSLGEEWHVGYVESESAVGISVSATKPNLELLGQEFAKTKVVEKIRAWLRIRVHEELVPLVEHIAEKRNFTINKILVKNQRTRWASCSSSKNISLNTKLLFLPPELVRYVMMHELCHTVHMNHSKDFWRLVESHEAEFRVYDERLREAWKMVPEWMY